MIVNYVVCKWGIFFLGMFSVCVTFMEILVVGLVFIDGGFVNCVLVIVSSYNVMVER